jgi:hypothetical protein
VRLDIALDMVATQDPQTLVRLSMQVQAAERFVEVLTRYAK